MNILPIRFFALVSLLGLLVPYAASATDHYWACDSNWWDATCWSATSGGTASLGQPQDGDDVYLIEADATNRTVSYSNILYPTAVLNSLQIDATGTGNMTLSQSQDSLSALYESVGLYGTGTFTQSGGTNAVTNNLYLGRYNGGNGSYILSGTGSVTATNEYMGYYPSASGSFIQNGGTNTAGNFIVGQSSGSVGSYDLSAGILSTVVEYVGNNGTGTFNQTGGTHAASKIISLGQNTGSNGSYNLSTGSLSTGREFVGEAGNGVFSQTGGTHAINTSLIFGYYGTASGTYSLMDGTLTVLDEEIGHSGSGAFTQTGGTHTVSGTMTLATNPGSGGTYTLSAGKLDAANIIVNAGGTFNFNGGTLAVGTFIGNLTNDGGKLAPGNSPGTTNITGDYTQSAAGTYAVELSGLLAGTEYDQLNVSGTATLGGTLNVSLFDTGGGPFTPHLGDSFDILTADLIQGSFGSLSLAALDPGLKWDISYLTDAIGTTDVVRLSVAAVPVPPAAWLFGSGLLGLIGIARRRGQTFNRTQSERIDDSIV